MRADFVNSLIIHYVPYTTSESLWMNKISYIPCLKCKHTCSVARRASSRDRAIWQQLCIGVVRHEDLQRPKFLFVERHCARLAGYKVFTKSQIGERLAECLCGSIVDADILLVVNWLTDAMLKVRRCVRNRRVHARLANLMIRLSTEWYPGKHFMFNVYG